MVEIALELQKEIAELLELGIRVCKARTSRTISNEAIDKAQEIANGLKQETVIEQAAPYQAKIFKSFASLHNSINREG